MLDNIETQGAFMNAFKHAFIGMAIVDVDGNFIMVNRSFCRILEFEQEELLQKNVIEVTPPQDYNLVSCQLQRLFNGETDAFEIEKRCYKKGGGIMWGRLSVSVYQDEKDRYLIIQLQDITERKLQEEELLEREREYRKLVEEAPDAMVIHDAEKFLFINQAGAEALQSSPQELVGQPLTKIIRQEEWPGFHERVAEALEIGRAEGVVELTVVLPDGKLMDILSTGSVINYQGKKAIQAVFRNNTAQKEFETKSNYLLQQYEKMNLVSEFAASVAHEIKNPLTILKGFIQLIEISKQNKAYTQYENLIFSEIDRIHLMVNEFLTLAKPSEEDMKLTDLHAALQQSIRLLNAHATAHNVTIHLEKIPPIPLLHAIENKMKQAFINIIKNAIEAMQGGGNLHIAISKWDGNIIIRFADEGCGMTEEELRKVTTPFFTTKTDGTGLGMMITNNIIKSHDGEMEVESQVGEGTKVSLIIPVSRQ
ncbi:PAS domain S-box protein [Thalassobacillus devorans]|uniref:PAS domain S-box protein n=1 Tax=Thalassobacillus devorans TaxID=279813 RepID=UPI000A1CD4CE|nr:PAS domain S-box protein [Thalassobacillus devorans]